MFCPKCPDSETAGKLRVIDRYIPRSGDWRIVCCDHGHFFKVRTRHLFAPHRYTVAAYLIPDETATYYFWTQTRELSADTAAFFADMEKLLGQWPTIEEFSTRKEK